MTEQDDPPAGPKDGEVRGAANRPSEREGDWFRLSALVPDDGRSRALTSHPALADDRGAAPLVPSRRPPPKARHLLLTLGLLLVAGSVYAVTQSVRRARFERVVRAELGLVERTLEQARAAPPGHVEKWSAALREARRVAVQHEKRAEGSALADEIRSLASRAAEGETEAQLVRARATRNETLRRHVTDARLTRFGVDGAAIPPAVVAAKFEQMIREYGIDPAGPPDEVAARVRESDVRDELVEVLWQWAGTVAAVPAPGGLLKDTVHRVLELCLTDTRQRTLWLTVRNRAWDTVLDLSTKWDPATLPARVWYLVGHELGSNGRAADAVAVLRTAQESHVGDFWLNYELGWWLQHSTPPRAAEAVGYYRAAMAVRPELTAVWKTLSHALSAVGQLEEASRLNRRARALDPARPPR